MAKLNDTYDIAAAFEAIEDELIASMIRNMRRHKQDEIDEDKQWSMWQAHELQALERYRRSNQKKFGSEFKKINAKIEALIRSSRDEGEMDQEISILEAIKNGFKGRRVSKGATAEFFKLNERKLDALINATVSDMEKAETAILRRANDQYRKIIFNAQVYANTGAGTYEKAVDMAARDMLSAGLTCVQYANGAMHTLSDYADMALRTASKRAYLQGEGMKRQEWNISTVIMNKRGNPCPKCLPFCGKVLIDDVWSGGASDGKSPVTGITYPLMSKAIAAGLYHPRCKDSHTTYFEGINTPPDNTYTKDELDQIAEDYKKEQQVQYAQRQKKKYERLEKYSLDKENRKKYGIKAAEWKKQVDKRGQSGILKTVNSKEEIQVHSVGKIDKEIYKCITDDIVTDEVIITDERIGHVKERHPNDFEQYCQYLKEIVEAPDYIIESNKVNTALILKEFTDAENRQFKTVLRLKTSKDDPEFKNSVITFMKINEKEWSRLLRNKRILYKKE